MRFVKVNGEHINVESIRSFRHIPGKITNAIQVYLTDDTMRSFNMANSQYTLNEISGAEHISQIIPCAEPLFDVYAESNGTFFAERVDYLALCADGELRTLSLSDGYFDIPDNSGNYKGVYRASQLSQFENIIIGSESEILDK